MVLELPADCPPADSLASPVCAATLLRLPTPHHPTATADYMSEARNVFRNPETTEFVIVAIPNAMAAAESIRLAKALRKEAVSASGGWRWVWGLL